MTVMLCRSRASELSHWESVFDAEVERHRVAGLSLHDLWRDGDDPDQVFFVFEVANLERARAFIGDPANAEFDYRFLDTASGC